MGKDFGVYYLNYTKWSVDVCSCRGLRLSLTSVRSDQQPARLRQIYALSLDIAERFTATMIP